MNWVFRIFKEIVVTLRGGRASNWAMTSDAEIFDENYRVVEVESQRLTVRGIRSGRVLTIHADSETPLSARDYPLGKLIALSDPAAAPMD